MKKAIFKSGDTLFPLISKVMQWHFKYYLLKKHSPLSCGIYVTNICNMRCEMCNIWRNPKLNALPMKDYKNIIDDLRDLGCYYVSLAGGEPLILRDIIDRLGYAKQRITYVHLVSNGYLLKKEMAEALASTKMNEVSISIDGLQELHDSMRGVEGTFEHALAAVDNLRTYAPKIEIVINSIISPKNISDLYKVAAMVEKWGLMHKFQPVNKHPVFDGQKDISNSYQPDTKEFNEIKKFTDFIMKKPNVANSRYFLSEIPNYFADKTNKGIFTDKCIYGYHHCEIKEDGDVYPCLTGMDWKNGFKLDNGLKNVIYTDEYKNKLKELETCELCQQNMYICYFEPRITFPITNYLKYKSMKVS